MSKLTLDEVGAEIDKTIDKLSRLQALYSAMLNQDHSRIEKLIREYNKAAKETKDAKHTGSTRDPSAVGGDGSGQPGPNSPSPALPDQERA